MAFDYSRVLEITSLGISGASNILITNTSGKKYIRNIIIHNTHTDDVTVTLFNVPNNGAAVGTKSILNQFIKSTIIPNDTLVIEIPAPGIILVDAYDSIHGYASVANVATIQMYGGYE